MGAGAFLLWKCETFWALTASRVPVTKSRRFWTVTKAAAEAILHREEKSSEIALSQLGVPLRKGNGLPTCQF